MNENIDILQMLKDESIKLSKGHREIAKYISENYDKAAFMTAAKLGEQTGVSESTVVRFCYFLGFDGYPEFQKSLQKLIKKKLTWVQRLSLEEMADQDIMIENSLKSDMKNLTLLAAGKPADAIKQIVSRILNANNIYIIGQRSSNPLAEFLYYYLKYVFKNIYLVNTVSGDIFGQLMYARKGDLIIGIGFPRYSKSTLDGLKFAKNNGADVATVTDNTDSPLYKIADCSVLVSSNMNSFVDSIVAPMSVINAIIVSVGMHKRNELIENFNVMEDIWAKFNIYGIDNEGKS